MPRPSVAALLPHHHHMFEGCVCAEASLTLTQQEGRKTNKRGQIKRVGAAAGGGIECSSASASSRLSLGGFRGNRGQPFVVLVE